MSNNKKGSFERLMKTTRAGKKHQKGSDKKRHTTAEDRAAGRMAHTLKLARQHRDREATEDKPTLRKIMTELTYGKQN